MTDWFRVVWRYRPQVMLLALLGFLGLVEDRTILWLAAGYLAREIEVAIFERPTLTPRPKP